MAERKQTPGAEDAGRNLDPEARKSRSLIRPGPLVMAGVLLGMLFLAKIVISALYVQGIPSSLSGAVTASAEQDSPPEVSLAEKEQQLKEKEERLRGWEEKLKKQEEQLAPLLEEVERKMAELEDLQAELTAYAETLAEREEALNDKKVQHLVSVYQAMEPQRAAAIMSKLEISTVVRILANMRGKSAGLILASMDPELSASISERLGKP
jgi:flagellar motility protein MotE (MotC chaperone)